MTERQQKTQQRFVKLGWVTVCMESGVQIMQDPQQCLWQIRSDGTVTRTSWYDVHQLVHQA